MDVAYGHILVFVDFDLTRILSYVIQHINITVMQVLPHLGLADVQLIQVLEGKLTMVLLIGGIYFSFSVLQE